MIDATVSSGVTSSGLTPNSGDNTLVFGTAHVRSGATTIDRPRTQERHPAHARHDPVPDQPPAASPDGQHTR